MLLGLPMWQSLLATQMTSDGHQVFVAESQALYITQSSSKKSKYSGTLSYSHPSNTATLLQGSH